MSTLHIKVPQSGNVYPVRIDSDLTVEELCMHIRSSIQETEEGDLTNFGLFVSDPDQKDSYWLDNDKMISSYGHLNIEIEFKSKLRFLVIQTMDGARKTLQVDKSLTVAELMLPICSRIGISNHEEYSLIRPMDDEEKMRTLTLRKAKSLAKDQDKLEKMKQKLHTDDELNWLPPGNTLRQNGVEESDVLLLRRKYFFSDQNVDTRDPVQLSLLYVQVNEAIFNGTHPVSIDIAIQLGALQLSVDRGHFLPERTKLSVPVKAYLPKEYVKIKGAEKRIIEEYRQLGSISERDAKLRYVQVCRSLPTYGITFFLIKEKQPQSNKLVPRLFGVSKEGVMRLDEKTKEILQTFPLTRIRQWAATASLFILKFGELSGEADYIIQTTDGERIAQLLAGYVDIINKRKRGYQTTMMDDNEGNTIVEDNVQPSKGNIISNISDTLPRGHRGELSHVAHSGTIRSANVRGDFSEGYLVSHGDAVVQRTVGGGTPGSGQILKQPFDDGSSTLGRSTSQVQIVDLGQPKRSLQMRVRRGLQTIYEASEDLEKPAYPDDAMLMGDDLMWQKWRSDQKDEARAGILSHLGAMTMAAGQLFNCIQPKSKSGNDLDYSNVDSSVATISMNVQNLIDHIRVYDDLDAYDQLGQRDKEPSCLKDATQGLLNAFMDLMKATASSPSSDLASSTMSSSDNISAPRSAIDRAALLDAVIRVGGASNQLLESLTGPHSRGQQHFRMSTSDISIDWELRDRLLEQTKRVVARMTNLVRGAKSGAMTLNDEAIQLSADGTDSSSDPSNVKVQLEDLLRSAQVELVRAATDAGRATSSLAACAKMAAVSIEQPESQQQLLRAARSVDEASHAIRMVTNNLVQLPPDLPWPDQMATHDAHVQLHTDIITDVGRVHSELDQLVNLLRQASIQGHQDPVVNTLLFAGSSMAEMDGDQVDTSSPNSLAMLIARSMSVSKAASQLVADLRTVAAEGGLSSAMSPEVAESRALMLQEAINQLHAAINNAQSGSDPSSCRAELLAAVERVIHLATTTAGPILRARQSQSLERATRLTAYNIGPLVSAGDQVVRICPGNTYKLASNLDELQRQVIPQLNETCNEVRSEPFNVKKQVNLLTASQALVQCLDDLLRSAEVVVPTIPDAGIQSAFAGATRNTQACLSELRNCYTNSEDLLSTDGIYARALNAGTAGNELALSQSVILQRSTGLFDQLAAKLDAYGACLAIDEHRMFPNETLDSVCVRLCAAVGQFNSDFALNPVKKADGRTDPGVGPRCQHQLLLSAPAGERRLELASDMCVGLADNLMPLLYAVRGLAGCLATAVSAPSLHPNFARLLLVCHGLSTPAQPPSRSTQSGGSSPGHRSSSTSSLAANLDQQARESAEAMLTNLLAIGESCLQTSRAYAQAVARMASLSSDQVEEQNQLDATATALAEELSRNVNALQSYVPGEVVVNRLLAQLQDTSLRFQNNKQNGGHLNRSMSIDPNDFEKLSQAAGQLAMVCQDTSVKVTASPHQLTPSHLSRSSSIARPKSSGSSAGGDSTSPNATRFGGDSQLVFLGHLADRVGGSISSLIACLQEAPSLGPVFFSDGKLTRYGQPVAMDFRVAMRSLGQARAIEVNGFSAAPQDSNLPQALLQLRDWANSLQLQAEQMQANKLQQTSTSPEHALQSIQSQCQSAVRQLTSIQPLLSGTDKGDDALFLPVRLPVSDQTYPECINSVMSLRQELHTITQRLSATDVDSKQRAASFTSAIQGLAQATCDMLKSTNQAAYLSGVADPASKPGSAGLLTSSPDDQSLLAAIHDHVAEVRHGASKVANTLAVVTPEGGDANGMDSIVEVEQTALEMANRARQLINSTSKLVAQCRVKRERVLLMEAVDRLEYFIDSIENTIQSVPANLTPDERRDFLISGQLVNATAQLEEAVDNYSFILLRNSTSTPCQLSKHGIQVQKPILAAGQSVVSKSIHLLQTAPTMLEDTGSQEQQLAQFAECANELDQTTTQLLTLLVGKLPAEQACELVQASASSLQRDLDRFTDADKSGVELSDSSLQTSLSLVKSGTERVAMLLNECVSNWQNSQWQLMGHNLFEINSLMANLTKESTRTALNLTKPQEQANMLNTTRDVMASVGELAEVIGSALKEARERPLAGEQIKPSPSNDSLVIEKGSQARRACSELSNQVVNITRQQGGLNWYIASIKASMHKLENVNSPNSELMSATVGERSGKPALPVSFAQLHRGFGKQLVDLIEGVTRIWSANQKRAGNSIFARSDSVEDSQVDFEQKSSAHNDMKNVVDCYDQLSTVTIPEMVTVLKSQAKGQTSGLQLANRLSQATLAVGGTLCDFLRAPGHTQTYSTFQHNISTLKSLLKSCSRGAIGCASVAQALDPLEAELEAEALFARQRFASSVDDEEEAGSRRHSIASPSGRSRLRARHREFSEARDVLTKTLEALVKDVKSLISNTEGAQNALAASAQNCLLRATKLVESLKALDRVIAPTKGQLNIFPRDLLVPDCAQTVDRLISLSKSVVASLGRLMIHGKSMAASAYATQLWPEDDDGESELMILHQKNLGDEVVEFSNLTSGLSSCLKQLDALAGQLVNAHESQDIDGGPRSPLMSIDEPSSPPPPHSPSVKSPPPPPPPPPQLKPRPQPKPRLGMMTSGSSFISQDDNPERVNVRAGLQNVVSRLETLSLQVGQWKFDAEGCIVEMDQDSMDEPVTDKPGNLTDCANAITTSASQSNAAASSGKLPEVGLAGETVGRVADELIQSLRMTCKEIKSAAGNRVYCKPAVDGCVEALNELKDMLEHMDKSLDSPPSNPSSIKVTLARRRLREPVHQITENAKTFPVLDERAPPPPPPRPPSLHMMSRKSTSIDANNSPSQLDQPSEVKRSIDAAKACLSSQTTEQVDAAETQANNELHQMAGDLSEKANDLAAKLGDASGQQQTSNRSSMASTSTVSEEDQFPSNVSDLLHACQHLAHSTVSFMYWAAAAQRELVLKGLVNDRQKDGDDTKRQWSQGFVSAARYVVEAVKPLVGCIKTLPPDAFQRSTSPQSDDATNLAAFIVSAARITATNTTQVLFACSALKPDASCKGCAGLSDAGQSVRQAADAVIRLVENLDPSAAGIIADTSEPPTSGVVSGIRNVIETKSSIAAKQREIDDLQAKLKTINQYQYKAS